MDCVEAGMNKLSFRFLALALLIANLHSTAVASDSVPDGLTATDWASIREAHKAWKHRFVEHEDETFSATNPGQQWTTVFDGRGFTTEPRGGAWQWGLELTGFGIGEKRRETARSFGRGSDGSRRHPIELSME